MKATIYHNPMCGTSRKTLDILRDSGADVWVREYLKDPPSREELSALYERAGITPRAGLRAREPLAAELGLTRPDVTDDEILDAMLKHPVLIERPLVETPNGVRLCRPQDLRPRDPLIILLEFSRGGGPCEARWRGLGRGSKNPSTAFGGPPPRQKPGRIE